MEIPEPFISIIKKNYAKTPLNDSKNLKNFFNNCFTELIDKLGITDYQARASKTGDMFEYAFWYLLKNKYGFNLVASVELPKACMCKGGKLDFGVFKEKSSATSDNMVCGIKAKGSDPKSSTRPALKRTDTMKKTISQAYQFKRVYSTLPFFVVTNVLPDEGNSKCMMDLAEGDIIDKFIDVTDIDQLNEFVKKIKSLQ